MSYHLISGLLLSGIYMSIKFDSYVVTLGFMVAPISEGGLGLKGNEAIVFATIYGFSQNGTSWYEGTQRYLAEWCGSTIRGVQKNLDSLIAKGYVEKKDESLNGVTLCRYRVTEQVLQSSYPTNRVRTPHEQSSHNNTIYNIPPLDIDSNESISVPPTGGKGFVKPTIDEIRAYCEEKGYQVDPETFWHHYESNGWRVGRAHMRSWKSALVTWQKNNRNYQKPENEERRVRRLGERD